MNFWHQIKNSIYNQSFYDELLEKPFKESLVYYLKLGGLLSLVFAFIFGFFLVPGLLRALWQLDNVALESFPAELEIKIESGLASTNVSEPYAVPMNTESRRYFSEGFDKNYENLLVINTATTSEVTSLLRGTSTLAVLSAKEVGYILPGGQVEIVNLSNASDLEIDKDKIGQTLEKLRPWYKLSAPLLIILLFILFLALVVFTLVVLLVQSLFSFVLLRLMKVKNLKGELSFLKAYQITLHGATLPLFLLFIAFGLKVPVSGFFLLVLVLLILYLNLCPCRREGKKSQNLE